MVEFPANIKQIGSIGDGMRIYVEDYVCSYLEQYAMAGGNDERLALLVGRPMIIDGQQVLFISGAIQGRYTTYQSGITVFTEKSFDYANEQMDKYFKDLEIVGWMQSQPSYGLFLNASYANYHMKNFSLPYQVMFIIDPLERVNCFYAWDSENDIKEAKGYFIYYDKNRGMHEYMMNNKISSMRVITENASTGVSASEDYEDEVEADEEIDREVETPERYLRAKTVQRRKKEFEPRRVTNMLVSLCGVLVVICFIMGAGLIQNEDRITTLEANITQLTGSYQALLDQVRQERTASVFASVSEPVSEEPQEETLSEPTQENIGEVIVEDGNMVMAEGYELVRLNTPAPEDTAYVEAVEIPDIYVVEQGDSLLGISRRFYGTPDMVKEIMSLNELDDPDKIYFGKVLKLPRPKAN